MPTEKVSINQYGALRTIKFGTQTIAVDYSASETLAPPPGVLFALDKFLLFLIQILDKNNKPEFLDAILALRERLSDHPEEAKAIQGLIASFISIDTRKFVLIEREKWIEATALLETASQMPHVQDLYVGEGDE